MKSSKQKDQNKEENNHNDYYAQSAYYNSPDPSQIPLPNFDEENYFENSKTDLLKSLLGLMKKIK